MSNEHLQILRVWFNHESSPSHNSQPSESIHTFANIKQPKIYCKANKTNKSHRQSFIGKKSIQLNLHPKSCPIHTGPNLNVTKWWWKERRRRYSQLSLGLGLGFKRRRVYEEVLDVRNQFFFLHSCVLSMLNCLQMESFSKQASKHLECLNVQYLVGARRFFFFVVWVCGYRKNLSFWVCAEF